MPTPWAYLDNLAKDRAGSYSEGGEHRDFPTHEVDFPLPRISKVYIENCTKVQEQVRFPPPEEPAIDKILY